MRIAVLYVGSSLLAPLRNAEQEMRRRLELDLGVVAEYFVSVFSDETWSWIETELRDTDVVFVIHVMDGENAARLIALLDQYRKRHRAVVVMNCMPALMKRTQLGRLNFARFPGVGSRKGAKTDSIEGAVGGESLDAGNATTMLRSIGSWIGRQARSKGPRNGTKGQARAQYLKLSDRLPSLLRFVPSAGALRDVKNYLMLFCYFLQPSPRNIRSMLIYALKHYLDDERVRRVEITATE